MTRKICSLAAICVATFAIADEPADLANLQGQWRLIETDHQGKHRFNTDPDFHEHTITIVGKEMTVKFPDGSERKKTFTIDTINSPKTMDLSSLDGREKGQAAACIYKLEPERFTICMPYFTDNPNQRPRDFKTTDTDQVNLTFIYERLK